MLTRIQVFGLHT